MFNKFSKEIFDNFKQVDPTSDDTVTFTKFIYLVSGVGFNKEPPWESNEKLCHPCTLAHARGSSLHPSTIRNGSRDNFSECTSVTRIHNTSSKLLEKFAPIPKATEIVELAGGFQIFQ